MITQVTQAVTAAPAPVSQRAASVRLPPAPAQSGGAPSPPDVQAAVNRANANLAGVSEGIRFGFNEALGQLFVQVVDQHSGQVIGQVPSKAFMDSQVANMEYIGMLLNRKG